MAQQLEGTPRGSSQTEEPRDDAAPVCTCGMTPQDPANQHRAGQRETSQPETWCRARLLEHVENMYTNLFSPPDGWVQFGAAAALPGPVPYGETWGQDLDGLPLWERAVAPGTVNTVEELEELSPCAVLDRTGDIGVAQVGAVHYAESRPIPFERAVRKYGPFVVLGAPKATQHV